MMLPKDNLPNNFNSINQQKNLNSSKYLFL